MGDLTKQFRAGLQGRSGVLTEVEIQSPNAHEGGKIDLRTVKPLGGGVEERGESLTW